MYGTVLITGANSSLAIPAVQYLLTKYPTYTVVLTVRNTSENDINTNDLRRITDAHPQSTISIRKLDLSSLSEVAAFADSVRQEILEGNLPRLVGLICNAFFWSLSGGPQLSKDGYELSIAVSHLAHTSLVVRLLDTFSAEGGRVIFLGSDTHWPGKNAPMEQFPPGIPDDLERLVRPVPEKSDEEAGRGFQRYGTAKLAVIMTMYELNNRLKEIPKLRHITALAFDPGTLVDSRAFKQDDIPKLQRWLIGGILNQLQPVLRFANPAIRRARHAGPDLIEVAVGQKFRGKEGYIVMNKEEASSPESQNQAKQKSLFDQTMLWCGLRFEDAATHA